MNIKKYKSYTNHNILFVLLLLLSLWSCGSKENKLPILGERDVAKKTVDGKEVVDTIYNAIPPFTFTNQYGDTINESVVKGKIYVADFFFTTCPTICPVMKRQMLKVYDQFKTNSNVMILSHTIDPEHDTPEVLNKFAQDLELKESSGNF